jgi:hypothetical protein
MPLEAAAGGLKQHLDGMFVSKFREFLGIAMYCRTVPLERDLWIAGQRPQRFVGSPGRPGFEQQVVGPVIDIPRLPQVGAEFARRDDGKIGPGAEFFVE